MLEAPGISACGLARFVMSAALVIVFLVLAAAAARAAVPASPPASASGRQVRLLQSSSIDPRARRCLTRLREELEAGGFEVAVREFGAGGEELWMVDRPSVADRSIATITLVGNPEQGPAELWMVNASAGGRAVVRRLLVPAGAGTHDDEVLAIRALEFLRASALELAGTRPPASAPSPSPSPSPPTSTVTTAPPPTTPNASDPSLGAVTARASANPAAAPALDGQRDRPLAVELGLSMINSSPALGPAFLPTARLRLEWQSLLETRLTLAAFGTRPELNRPPRGTAAVGHALALAELRAAFLPGRAVRPAIGIGVGALRVTVDGTGTVPYEGAGGQRWAALFDVGAGLTVRLATRISIALELHGQLAAPYPTVRFSGQEAARVARPALFSSLTLVTPL